MAPATTRVVVLLFGIVLVHGFLRSEPPEERAKIYDEEADAKTVIATAVASAKKNNKRVLLVYGGNWCGWCHKLHQVFTTDSSIRKTLLYEYNVVFVDVGHFDKHMDIVKAYGAGIGKEGVPYLTVLDGDGKVLANQDTGSLESGDHHDRDKVQEFLRKWSAPPADAEKTLKDALARAAKESKRVLVHLGAPWCGWCHRLEEFLEQDAVAKVLNRDYVIVKIDTDRMQLGKAVAERLRRDRTGGIPWMVILSADGKELITSDGPSGNVGCPVRPEERAYFLGMLEKTSSRMGTDGLSLVKTSLDAYAETILGGR